MRKLFANLCCCRTLCSFLSGQVINYLQRSYIILLSKLTLGTAKSQTRPEEVLLMGPVQTPMVDHFASAWFHTLSALQAKPRCSLDGSAPWVAPSLSMLDHCTSV
jgi:hypothetical protein